MRSEGQVPGSGACPKLAGLLEVLGAASGRPWLVVMRCKPTSAIMWSMPAGESKRVWCGIWLVVACGHEVQAHFGHHVEHACR